MCAFVSVHKCLAVRLRACVCVHTASNDDEICC